MSYTNASSFSLQITNTTRFHVNITNYGPVDSNATLNTINFTETCADYNISGATGSVSGAGCVATYSSTANIYNVTVPPNGSSCMVWWTITAGSTGTGSACTGYVKGGGTWFNPTGLGVTITVGTSSSSTTTSTSSTAATPTTTSNMEFTTAEILMLVQQNSSNYTDVGIKNTGTKSLDITFSVEGIDSSWYALNATSKLIGSGFMAGFRVTFDIGSEEVKNYAGTYKAVSTGKTITKNFTLRVTPAPSTQIEINDTLAQYKLNLTELEKELNQTKEENVNVTIAEQKLAELKSKIAEAENYIEQGDYFSASQLLNSIKNLIDDTKNELSKAKEIIAQKKSRLIWIYAGIGAAVVVVGVVAYLFWPSKGGFHPKKGFAFKEKKITFGGLKPLEKESKKSSGIEMKGTFEKIKERFKKAGKEKKPSENKNA